MNIIAHKNGAMPTAGDNIPTIFDLIEALAIYNEWGDGIYRQRLANFMGFLLLANENEGIIHYENDNQENDTKEVSKRHKDVIAFMINELTGANYQELVETLSEDDTE